MLQANLLMFSRSLSVDYRWIYADPSVTLTDKSLMLKDFRAFELNRSFFLGERHRIVRRLENAVAVYSFSKTGKTDSCSRPIFALTGLVFSGLDAEIVLALPQMLFSLLFYVDNNFDPALQAVSDEMENRVLPVEFSLDQALETYRTSPELSLLAGKLSGASAALSDTSLLITAESVSPMRTEARSRLEKATVRADSKPGKTGNTAPWQQHEAVKSPEKSNLVRDIIGAVFGYPDNFDD